MKRDIARKWIKALESGDYTQGTGALRNKVTNNFCCLGVLCNLHAQEHPEIAAEQDYAFEYLGQDGVLPTEVMEWAGMASWGGWISPLNTDLASLNDNDKYNFKQIAKVIRQNWKSL